MSKPIHDIIINGQSVPPIARALYANVFNSGAMPENAVQADVSLSVDCTSGWAVGKDSNGNLIIATVRVFERATNPTLPTQTAIKTWG